jgi:hypothetical protein
MKCTKLALIHKAQSPAPKTFKVGSRSTLATMVVKLTVTIATTGYVYSFLVDGKDYTYTVLAGATTTTVATALAALITGGTAGATATAAVAVITITAAAGKVFDVSGWVANAMTIDDTTADPGITADLTAINAEDSEWYGLIPDHFGKAEALAAALWVESEHKVMIVDTFQSGCMDSVSTTDIMYALKQLGYTRTGTMHSKNKVLHRSGAAWLAGRFVAAPGSDTWKFKSLTGVAASKYKTGERNAIKAKKGNWYETVAGLDMTAEGWSASGEFMDTVRGVDWLHSEMQIQVFAQMMNAPKIPYTDPGAESLGGTLMDVLDRGVKVNFLAANPVPTVTVPKVADVDPVTRATRTLPEMSFDAKLAGAVHNLSVTGRLSV